MKRLFLLLFLVVAVAGCGGDSKTDTSWMDPCKIQNPTPEQVKDCEEQRPEENVDATEGVTVGTSSIVISGEGEDSTQVKVSLQERNFSGYFITTDLVREGGQLVNTTIKAALFKGSEKVVEHYVRTAMVGIVGLVEEPTVNRYFSPHSQIHLFTFRGSDKGAMKVFECPENSPFTIEKDSTLMYGDSLGSYRVCGSGTIKLVVTIDGELPIEGGPIKKSVTLEKELIFRGEI